MPHPKRKIPDDQRIGLTVAEAVQISGLCRASVNKLIYSGPAPIHEDSQPPRNFAPKPHGPSGAAVMGGKLTRYDAARHALEAAATVDEVKEIHDQSEALRAYARQIHDAELEAWSAEIKLRARARIGELSKGLERTDQATRLADRGSMGIRWRTPMASTPSFATLAFPARLQTAASRFAASSSVTPSRSKPSSRVSAPKKEPVTEKQILQMVGREIIREDRVEKLLRRAEAFPNKRYGILLADPPWRYDAPLSDSCRIENKYPTMALDAIMALPVGDIAAPDAALFLWAALLEEGFEVLRAWGFRFRSHAVWVKPSVGMGRWFRQQHEMLLLGVRGHMPVPLEANRSPSVIIAPRGEHSEKPDAAYEIIERGFPEFPKIELFARRSRYGWERWGLEAEACERTAAE
jgi:N6-adenosine-specific RNA methylase IME4